MGEGQIPKTKIQFGSEERAAISLQVVETGEWGI